MSIFSAIGKVAKGIGKGVLSVAKTGVNVAASTAGIGPIFQSATTAAPVAETVLTQVPTTGSGSWVTDLMRLPGALVDTLTGKTHIQTDVNVGSQSPLPSWALPVGLGLGALLLFSGKKSRY